MSYKRTYQMHQVKTDDGAVLECECVRKPGSAYETCWRVEKVISQPGTFWGEGDYVPEDSVVENT